MQARRVVLLDDEAVALALELAALAAPSSSRSRASGCRCRCRASARPSPWLTSGRPPPSSWCRSSAGARRCAARLGLGLRLRAFASPAVVAEALLERRHQVDDVGALGGGASASGSWMTFSPFLLLLLGDQALAAHRRSGCGIRSASNSPVFLLDQRRGEVEQIRVGLGVADLAEIARRLVDLVGVAQRLQQHAAAARLQRDDIFLAAHRQLADADLLRLAQRLAQDDERFLGKVVGGHDVIGLFDNTSRRCRAMSTNWTRSSVLRLSSLTALDLLGVEQHVMALRHLIALDDLVAVDRADAGHDLLIFDALARRLVDLVELDRRAALGRRIELDRDRDQRQPDLSPPNRSCRHDRIVSLFRSRFNQRARGVVPCRCFECRQRAPRRRRPRPPRRRSPSR